MKKILLLTLIAAVALMGACVKKSEPPAPEASLEIIEPAPQISEEPPSEVTDLTPQIDVGTPEPEETPEPLVDVGNNATLDDMLVQGEPMVDYVDKNSYIQINVKNITKSTLKGGLVYNIYDGDKLIATVPVIVNEENNADNVIKPGDQVYLFGELAGKDCSSFDIELASDPANPFKPAA